MKQRLGFMYIAKRPCGKVTAAAWDEPDSKKETAKSVARWLEFGFTVERIERHDGDPQPEWICHSSDRNCKCRDAA